MAVAFALGFIIPAMSYPVWASFYSCEDQYARLKRMSPSSPYYADRYYKYAKVCQGQAPMPKPPKLKGHKNNGINR